MKKIIAVLLILVCAITTSLSCFAADETISPLSSGNGYNNTTVSFNNYVYDVNVGAGYNLSEGAYTGCTTSWKCKRIHSGVSLYYLSNGSGYKTKTSSSKTYKKTIGTTKSNTVKPTDIINPLRVSGTVTVSSVDQNNITISKTLSVALTWQ